MKRFILPLVLALVIVLGAIPPSRAVSEADYNYYIEKYLKVFTNLTAAEVLTVIDAESGFNEKLVVDEPNVNDQSWGPMCVRGKTSRLMKFKGELEQLCTWEYGLYYGMKYLNWSKEKALKSSKNPEIIRKRTWAGYNAGHYYIVHKPDGTWAYVNEGYVTKCERLYSKYSELTIVKKLMAINEDNS